MTGFDDKDVWIFDLDNTLYPAESNLFLQVRDRMNAFIERYLDLDADGASKLRREYYLKYGTTLAGLMAEHGLEPDEFLADVHDIDHSALSENPALAEAIGQLAGKRYIFTNGSTAHAEGVAAKVGVLDLFDGIFDIKASNYIPKPHRDAFDMMLAAYGIDPERAAMFEDLPHNLETAHALGMTTVLVHSSDDDHPSQKEMDNWSRLPEHVHHATDDLAAFLGAIGS